MFLQVSVCPQRGVCVWLLRGEHAWLLQGVCGFFWGVRGFFRGRHVWFFPGVGVQGFFWGACVGYDEIRSMSGRYASYWNAFFYEYNVSTPYKYLIVSVYLFLINDSVINKCFVTQGNCKSSNRSVRLVIKIQIPESIIHTWFSCSHHSIHFYEIRNVDPRFWKVNSGRTWVHKH